VSLFGYRITNSPIYQLQNDVVLCLGGGGGVIQQGTQQENSYRKHAITNRIPVTAPVGRVNEAFSMEFVDKVMG